MVINFGQAYNKPVTLALGYFDSVHIGHRALINKSREFAHKADAECAVFTFRGNLYKVINSDQEQVYTFDERKEIFNELGVDIILAAEPDPGFINMSPQEFLNKLTSLYNIKKIYCGMDFRFGYGAKGDLDMLDNYFGLKGIDTEFFDMVTVGGAKISTRDIKRLIRSGDTHKAKDLLGSAYSVSGVVISGRKQGRIMGYPTANIKVDNEKVKPKEGVYATKVIIDGSAYNAVTNAGARPTFNESDYTVESHIINYRGEMYGKHIKVLFYERIRDIRKFSSVQELTAQIKSDTEYIK
jgi:riboflavin kinase/FMN adenylyltransferase